MLCDKLHVSYSAYIMLVHPQQNPSSSKDKVLKQDCAGHSRSNKRVMVAAAHRTKRRDSEEGDCGGRGWCPSGQFFNRLKDKVFMKRGVGGVLNRRAA